MKQQQMLLLKVILAGLIVGQALSMRFLVSKEQEICLYESLPPNEELVTQIIVEKDSPAFNLTIIHMNSKGKTIGQRSTLLYNSRDVFVHDEGSRSV
jgi:hypothetical protein